MQINALGAMNLLRIMQLALAIMLNSVGLYLLATTRKKRIMTLLMMHMSLMEITCTLLWAVEEIYYYIFSTWPIKYNVTIVIAPMTALFLTLAAITIERVLAVLLTIKFRMVVTKRRLALVLACVWFISLSMVMTLKFSRKVKFNHIMLFLDSLLIIVYVGSYSYILITVKRRRRELRSNNGGPNTSGLNLKVPFLLMLTITCFSLIPDLVLVAGLKRPNWYSSLFYVNYISDPLIYLFGMPECKKRIKIILCCTVRSDERRRTTSTVTTISCGDSNMVSTTV